jgi:hypothetical protein
MGMSRPRHRAWIWLCSAVVAHLVVSFAHGTAHERAHVDLPPASAAFVYVVILAGPLIGLALTWPAERLGSWLIAVTMAAALVFGLVNHFVLSSPDHVSHVAGEWRGLFATTAALLAGLEAAGAGLAWHVARGERTTS